MVNRIAGQDRSVEIRCDDPSLTSAAGLLLVSEVDAALGVVESLDAHIGSVKQRRRGVSGGELVMSWAEMMLAGGDFMADLDDLRGDVAGSRLRTVAEAPAPTTAAELARRFDDEHLAGVEAANAEVVARAVERMPERTRQRLQATRPTIDVDPTDVQVYGVDKERVGWTYEGRRCGRPCPATWAEAGVTLAGELTAGDDDPGPVAPGVIDRAVAALPAGLARPRVRADAGLFSRHVAHAARQAGAGFAIAAKRNSAIWRAIAATPEDAWQPADGMEAAEVAEVGYAPQGWPAATRAVVRRVPVAAADVSADPRARRRRTFDPRQLQLGVGGQLDTLYSYTIIITDLAGDPAAIEAWFRQRAQVEERLTDSKLGMALRHLPSGYERVNRVWMWAALWALNLSALLQALAGLDVLARAHGKRLRRDLLCVPGRVVSHSGKLILRLAPHRHLLPEVYQRLRRLPRAG